MAEGPEPAAEPSSGGDPTPPMLPSRGAFLLAFGAVALAGVLGGIIGFGIADVSSQTDLSHVIGALIGALIGAGGVGIVAVLVLRAMAEWRRQDPNAPRPPRRPS
jgi:hypothetical protein